MGDGRIFLKTLRDAYFNKDIWNELDSSFKLKLADFWNVEVFTGKFSAKNSPENETTHAELTQFCRPF
jgi:hypothetical protein